jgi:hypothetical protein
MDGVEVLQPVDPTKTGEDEVSRAVREALKRKRDDEDEHAAAPTVVAAPLTLPTKSCVHEVALPAGFAGDREALLAPRLVGKRAKEYPFTLDPFQETAIACLVRAPPLSRPLRRSRSRPELTERLTRLLLQERRESVLVAAHTSAGKTVVAECVRLVMRVRNRKHQRHRQRSLVLLRVACAVTVLRAHAACICALSPQVRHRHGAARQAEGHLYFAAQGTLRQSQQFCVVVSDCLLPLPRRRCPTRSTAS